jgi:hypothetical protein
MEVWHGVCVCDGTVGLPVCMYSMELGMFVIKFCIIYHNMGFCAKKGKWILHICILLVDVA